MAMATAPEVKHFTESNILKEDYIDDVITDYSVAKAEVKQSFLGRMVGPAFAAGALAAAATLAPWPVGAQDMSIFADEGLNPSVIPGSMAAFPTVSSYMGTFVRNAAITGTLAASVPAIQMIQESQEEEESKPVEKTA